MLDAKKVIRDYLYTFFIKENKRILPVKRVKIAMIFGFNHQHI